MLGSCSRRLQFLIPNCISVGDSVTHLRFFRKEVIFIRPCSSKSLIVAENDKLLDKDGSFTVSYLINSCGLSPELAFSASKKVRFDTRDGPDSVLNLFKHHGFTDAHISILVKKRPHILLVNSRKTLLPKLEFFGSVGISDTCLAHVICCNPDLILTKSLERSIMPCYDTIKSLCRLENFKVDMFFTRLQWMSNTNLISNIAPNFTVLRAHDVSESLISQWVSNRPFVMSLETEKFKENVNKVISMGISPSSSTTLFMQALHVITVVSASLWAHKMELYRKWGWTEDDFLLAFRKNPLFVKLSEKNISRKMDLLVNKMGWQPADVAGISNVLNYSWERTIPRCAVIRVLLLKNLIVKEKLSLSTVVICGKQYFLDKFVNKYQGQVPELVSIFEGKMGLGELGLGFEE